MKEIESYPVLCRQAIRKVAKRLKTDYETAYAMICLKAVMMDLKPSDAIVSDTLIRDCTCG